MSNEITTLRRLVSENMNVGLFIRSDAPTPKRSGKISTHTFWYVFHHFVWPRCFSTNPERIKPAIEWMERQKKWYEECGMQFPPQPIYYN